MSQGLRFRSYLPSLDVASGEEARLTRIETDHQVQGGAFSTFSIVQNQNQRSQVLASLTDLQVMPSTSNESLNTRAADLEREMFERTLHRFEQQYDRSFPSIPCAYCGVLLLPRSCQWQSFDGSVSYPLLSVLGTALHTTCKRGVQKVATCSECQTNPRNPIDAGPWPELLLRLPQRSRVYLSPLTLQTSLGRTSRPHGRDMSHWANYRTVTGMQ